MLKITKIKQLKRQRRQRRVRLRLRRESPQRPRLSVFRSLRHIYAQIIDDQQQRTLVAASDLELSPQDLASVPAEYSTQKVKQAYLVGQKIAQKALAAGITVVSFDRGAYRYHGRVKALAAGARAGGLKF